MTKESFYLKNEIPFQKLPNNLGQHNVAKGFKKLNR